MSLHVEQPSESLVTLRTSCLDLGTLRSLSRRSIRFNRGLRFWRCCCWRNHSLLVMICHVVTKGAFIGELSRAFGAPTKMINFIKNNHELNERRAYL